MAAAASSALNSIVVPAVTKHTATVIFVHGLGDTGHGWKPVADMFKADPALGHVKWILPHSPIRAVTANMGMEMPSWFNIYSFGFNTTEDEAGMLESAKSIGQLIAKEIDEGLDPGRVILGGFSQGATMSLLTGMSLDKKLAGLAVLSGWLPLKDKFKSLASPHASSLPIFWGSGRVDPLVKFELVTESVEVLSKGLDIPVTQNTSEVGGISFNVYEGIGHTTNQKELDDLKTWIKHVLPHQ